MHPALPYYRQTKIIATLGPATESKEMLAKLILAGVDILRLNMAHATHQWVNDAMWFIREASTEVRRHVAVMMDVKSPEDTIRHALRILRENGWCNAGSTLVVITNALARGEIIDTLRLRLSEQDVKFRAISPRTVPGIPYLTFIRKRMRAS